MPDSKFNSRKFILSAFVILVQTFMLYVKAIDAAAYNTLVISTLGLYFTGNIAEKSALVSGTK